MLSFECYFLVNDGLVLLVLIQKYFIYFNDLKHLRICSSIVRGTAEFSRYDWTSVTYSDGILTLIIHKRNAYDMCHSNSNNIQQHKKIIINRIKNESIARHNPCSEKYQQTIKLALFLLLSTCSPVPCAYQSMYGRVCVHACILYFEVTRTKKEIMIMRIFMHIFILLHQLFLFFLLHYTFPFSFSYSCRTADRPQATRPSSLSNRTCSII